MGMILQLFRINSEKFDTFLQNSQLFQDYVYDDETPDKNRIDIDKSWDGIGYLLTGAPLHDEANELCRVLFSHQFIKGTEEMGYGPAMYLLPEEVIYFNQKLAAITKTDLESNFNPAKMSAAEIYPEIWADNTTAFDYLYHYFENIKSFYAKAATENQIIITFLS